jgi:F0F1-type ATP synthase membrane subunit c/vacuolar-type H+-ATPase subunit K
MPNISKYCLLSLLLAFSFLSLIPPTFAQSNNDAEGSATLGVARIIETKEKNVKDGSIMTSTEKGTILSNFPYDPHVVGVVSRDAAIILSTTNSPNGVPVIAMGTVYVLVSASEGVIQKGDLLTTSAIPGVAVKAVKSGYVIGTALEGFTNTNPKQAGKIVVDLDLHYFNSKPTFAGTLTDLLKIAVLPTKDAPAAIFKYIVAAGVILGSFVLTFMTFGRTAAKGVEALGRNPAASKIIHLGIIFNVGICAVITIAGLGVAFLILRL